MGAVAKANIAAYIELLGEIRKMVAGRAEEGVRGGDTPSEMLARLPPADMYSVLKRLDTMADR